MGVVDGSTNWNGQDNFFDFIQFHAERLGMTREEYISHYGRGIDEADKKPGPDPYHRGLDDDEVEDKEDQIKKQAKMDDDDPDAYKEMPGDKEAREKGEVKKSKHTKKYAELYGESVTESKYDDLNEGIGMGAIEPFLPVILAYIESGGAGRLVHSIKNNLKAIPKVINNFRNMKDITRILRKLEKHPKINGYLNNLDPEGVEVMFQELSMADMKLMYSHLGLDWNPKEYLEIKRKADKGEWAKESYDLDEGVMSDIDLMIQRHDSFDSFEKEFFKEYGHKKVMKRTPEFLEWLKALYNDFEYANGMAVEESEVHDEMAYGQLERIIDYANMLRDRYDNGFVFDPWMHGKITKAKDYLNTIYDAIDGGDGEIEEANGFVKTFDQLVNEKDQSGENDQSPIDDDKIETALKKKAEDTGVPIGIIRVIMRRGMAAWKSGHRPGANQQQWGYARVNSFLTKQEGTWDGADADMAKEVRDGGHDKNLKKG
jgi:hypothetical protein